MKEINHPERQAPRRAMGGRLAWCSIASMLIIAILVPNFVRAGGMEVPPIGFLLVMAFAGLSSVAFIWCPRRHFIAKFVTFLCLLPVLKMTVDVLVVVVGRWFDPGFGHC